MFIFEKCGKGITINKGFRVNPFNYDTLRIKIYGNSYIAQNVTMQGSGLIEIGEWSSIGNDCVIGSAQRLK